MKTRAVLVVSIAANVALAVAVSHARFSGTSRTRFETNPATGAFFTLEPRKGENSPMPLPSMSPTAFHWRQLESSDYRQYIANLRAIGCPEETIRDLIISEKKRGRLQTDASLSDEQKTAAWNPIGTEIEKALANLSAEENYRAYRRHGSSALVKPSFRK